jgi:hypothetical protein
MPNPFYTGPFLPRRQRRVTELPPHEDRVTPPTDEAVAQEVFDRLAKVANKAKVIYEASEKLAEKLWIPVSPAAERVRGAVKRKDQNTPDGSRITFDLFKDALETLERRRDAVKLQSFEDLTGNALADDQSIRLWMNTTDYEDLNQEQALMMVSGLMVPMTLNFMLGPFKGTDTQQAVAGKIYPGTEVGPILAQTIIGIVYQLLVAGLEETLVEDFLHRSGAATALSTTIPDIMQQARAREPDEMQMLAERSMGEGDYEMILEYAYDFLGRTQEEGYESWVAYGDARSIRQEAVTQWRSAPLYSQRHALRNSRFEASSTTTVDTDLEDALRDSILDSIVPADVEYMCALSDQANRLDDTLNTIGQVMSSRFGQDALCCVGQFLSRNDTKWIQRANQILKIFMGTQGTIRQLDFNRVVSNLVNFLDARIRQELVDLIHQVVHKIADPLLEALDEGYKDEDWGALYACPLIHDLIELLLNAVKMIGTSLTNIVAGISIEWEAQFGQPVRDRWQVIHTRRRAKVLLEVTSQTLNALETGLLCVGPDGKFEDEEIKGFVETLPNTPAISIAPEDVQRFFADSRPIQVSDNLEGVIGGTIPSVVDPVIRTPMNPENEPESTRHCRELFNAILEEERDG